MKPRFVIFLLFLALCSCRSVIPAGQLRPSSAPDISRLTLKNGTVVEFNQDFGWFDKEKRLVEGTTKSGTHVQYFITEIGKVETVRAYAIFFGIAVATVIGAIGIYLLAKLLTLV